MERRKERTVAAHGCFSPPLSQAVLPKEFVGPNSDKLLGAGKNNDTPVGQRILSAGLDWFDENQKTAKKAPLA